MAKKRTDELRDMLPYAVKVVDSGKNIGWLGLREQETDSGISVEAYGFDGSQMETAFRKGGERKRIPSYAYESGEIRTITRFSDGEVKEGLHFPAVRLGELLDNRTAQRYVVLPGQTISSGKIGLIVSKLVKAGVHEVQLADLLKVLSRL